MLILYRISLKTVMLLSLALVAVLWIDPVRIYVFFLENSINKELFFGVSILGPAALGLLIKSHLKRLKFADVLYLGFPIGLGLLFCAVILFWLPKSLRDYVLSQNLVDLLINLYFMIPYEARRFLITSALLLNIYTLSQCIVTRKTANPTDEIIGIFS